MEVFNDLDETQNALTTILKPHFDDDDDDNDDNDDYDVHQSKLLAEQFEMNDDDVKQNQNDTSNDKNTGHMRKLTSALQRVKLRMQAQLNAESNNVTQSISIEQTQVLNTGANDNDKNTDEDEDEIIKPTRKSNIVSYNENQEAHIEDQILIATTETQIINSSNSLPLKTQNIEDHKSVEKSDDSNDQPYTSNNNEQLLNSTQLVSEEQDDVDDDDDDDDDIIRSTQRKRPISSKNAEDDDDDEGVDIPSAFTKTQPTSQLSSLFVGEDEENEKDNNNEADDDISKRIENYKNMTKEQRYLARKLELSKIRAEKRANENQASFSDDSDDHDDDDDELINSKHISKKKHRKPIIEKKKLDREKKEELIRQNELLKRSIEKMTLVRPTKFSKSKLLDDLNKNSDNESEGGVDNHNVSNTKVTNHLIEPQISLSSVLSINKIVNSKKNIKNLDKVIDLSSESDNNNSDLEKKPKVSNIDDELNSDSDDPDSSITKRTKMLDMKVFFSKKKQKKLEKIEKLTLSNKIKKLNAKQLRLKLSNKLTSNHNKSAILSDDILAKMLLEEQMKNSNLKSKEQKRKEGLEKQRKLLLEGKLKHDDDPEYSEYSSEYDISDDEDDNDVNDDDNDDDNDVRIKTNDDIQSTQNIESNDNKFKLSNTDAFKDFDFSLTQIYDKTQTQNNDKSLTGAEKFEKLKNQLNNVVGNRNDFGLETQQTEESSFEISNIHNSDTSFLTKQLKADEENGDEIDTKSVQLKDLLDSQNLVIETQPDSEIISTQQLTNSTQLSESTQKGLMEENVDIDGPDNEDDDDDDDDDEKIMVGRKLKKAEDNESGSDNEESGQKRAELIKLAKKQERQLQKQRDREFKSMGLSEIMEKEAIESEDEYQGTGGADKDFSDEENSEDEKLIDDTSNLNIDENELRKFQLEKELIEDREQVSKTYKDVKTHKLAERRAKDGVYGLSDDENDENDEYLKMREYIRRRKLRERNELLKRNKINISEDDPKKPFFDAMSVDLPSHISIYKDSFTNILSELNSQNANDDVPDIGEKEFKEYYENINGNDEIERPSLKKRKTKSFQNDDDIRFSSFKDQEVERLKYDVLSDNTDDDDDADGSKQLKLLKKKTNVKLSRKLKASKNNSSHNVNPTKSINLEDDFDSGSFGMLATNSISITASFKKETKKKLKISPNTGNIIREVQVTTSAKSVSNSKAAVTRLTSSESVKDKNKEHSIKGSSLDRLDRMLAKSRKRGIKPFNKV